MIEEISNRLLTEFAASLQAMLAGPAEYETFVGMPAVGAADAGKGDKPKAKPKPKPKPRKDLAAAAEAVAAASEPVRGGVGACGGAGLPARSCRGGRGGGV